MLVLARKPDEKVVIQTPVGEIVITCVRAGKRQIRLGIDAPANCNVLRQECFLPRDEIELVRETIREEWAA
ncbi:MAG: carbon storage regulator [Planctomycetia bacterium]|nr:carbon storage regulator [Planctomycetia bacterium]